MDETSIIVTVPFADAPQLLEALRRIGRVRGDAGFTRGDVDAASEIASKVEAALAVKRKHS